MVRDTFRKRIRSRSSKAPLIRRSIDLSRNNYPPRCAIRGSGHLLVLSILVATTPRDPTADESTTDHEK